MVNAAADSGSRFNALKNRLQDWKLDAAQRKGQRDQLVRVRNAEQETLENSKDEQHLAHQARLFLLSEIVERRQEAVRTIEEMSSSALRLVYGEGYRLQFETFEEKRQKDGEPNFKMEIQVVSPYEDEGELATGLIGERGGGVVEIVSFALRIAALNWLNYDGPLVMDEAYKSMSHDSKIESVARFLRDVTNHTGRQIIFATHMVDVFSKVADRVITVDKVKGVARVQMSNGEDGAATHSYALDDDW